MDATRVLYGERRGLRELMSKSYADMRCREMGMAHGAWQLAAVTKAQFPYPWTWHSGACHRDGNKPEG